MDREVYDKITNASAEEKAATFKAAPEVVSAVRAQSSNPVAHLMIDLTQAAIKAWEVVRDNAKPDQAIALAVSPAVYVDVAAGAVIVDIAKGGDGAKAKEHLTAAVLTATEAGKGNTSARSGQSWGGMQLVPDGRVEYIGVGVAKRPEGFPAQVFDAAQYEALTSSLADMLKQDAFDAASEKISVPGVVGNA